MILSNADRAAFGTDSDTSPRPVLQGRTIPADRVRNGRLVTVLAARASLDMCPMFGDLDIDRWDVEHLTCLKFPCRLRAQSKAAAGAVFHWIFNDMIRVCGALVGLSLVTWLATSTLATTMRRLFGFSL